MLACFVNHIQPSAVKINIFGLSPRRPIHRQFFHIEIFQFGDLSKLVHFDNICVDICGEKHASLASDIIVKTNSAHKMPKSNFKPM